MTLEVPSTCTVFLAAAPDGTTVFPPGYTAVAPDNSPIEINLSALGSPEFLTFYVTGVVGSDGLYPTDIGADGGGGFRQLGPYLYVDRVDAPVMSLMGVFLPAGELEAGHLIGLHHSTMAYPRLAPALQQPFVVGDGVTSCAEGFPGGGMCDPPDQAQRQVFKVPAGALKLYLGIHAFPNNNYGSFTVTVEAVR